MSDKKFEWIIKHFNGINCSTERKEFLLGVLIGLWCND